MPKSMVHDTAIQHAFRIANKAGLSREDLDDHDIAKSTGLRLEEVQRLREGDSQSRLRSKLSLKIVLSIATARQHL
ncbi:MAG: hypothetical protein Q9M20_04095 [Mariprofundaceae bacterium]|nr:hypothetical protein [Mariprofundaceae bacterium]